MRMRPKAWWRPVAVVILLAAAIAAWWLRPKARGPAPAENAPVGPAIVAAKREEPAYSPVSDELHAADRDEAHDLAVLRDLLGQLTTALRLSERPPLGDNADIAAALTGRNRRRIVFVPPTHPALRDGLLVDRHGTPYHFHARSADAIDVRSAGADRVLFTEDDVVSGGR